MREKMERKAFSTGQDGMPPLNESLYAIKASGIREFSRLAAQTPGCVALTLGEPEYDTPEPIRTAAKISLDEGDTHYIENAGKAQLRQAISRFEKERQGLDYEAEEIIVTAGATEGLFLSLFGILNPGDQVIVPMPAFPLYEEIITLCRGEMVPLPTEEDGFYINEKKLKEKISDKTKVILLNSPNNPTGIVYDRDSLRAVEEAVRGTNIYVICDDVYDQLAYEPGYEGFASYGRKKGLRGQILVVQSFSKPYAMTGWRMGYLLGDGEIIGRLKLLHQYLVVSTPSPFQKAAIMALKQDCGRMRDSYKQRRNFMTARLREMGLPVAEPGGAFYVFPSIQKFGLDSETFCRRMIAEAGLAATPGACFGVEGYIRLTYCYTREEIEEGLRRLESFLHILEEEMGEKQNDRV